jgi:hypothetical protein
VKSSMKRRASMALDCTSALTWPVWKTQVRKGWVRRQAGRQADKGEKDVKRTLKRRQVLNRSPRALLRGG